MTAHSSTATSETQARPSKLTSGNEVEHDAGLQIAQSQDDVL